MESQQGLLPELLKIQQIVMEDPNNLPKGKTKRFWWIVGRIKRQSAPDPQLVKVAADIRDRLYLARLGPTKPIRIVLPLWTGFGLGIIGIVLMFSIPDLVLLAAIISVFFTVFFSLGFIWIIGLSRRIASLLLVALVGGTIIIDVILGLISLELLVFANQFLLFAVIPCFYLHGRYIGGLIARIRFDGVSRDVFHLPTLKINYESYLLASPPSRQWIFLFGGLGTVVTSFLVAVVQLLVFGVPYLIIVPIMLLVGEILDYLNLAGSLGGGEFSHLRRERRIIKDWKAK
ncbi:MAG: hypothetical protein ACFFE8_04440 [Candidatus Heimdallarchaeota archaeon]